MREIILSPLVDRDAEGMDTAAARLEQGLARILDAVFATIIIMVIIGLSIG